LLVGVGIVDSNSRTISGITYNSVSLTQIYGLTPMDGGFSTRKYALYYLIAPSTGANNIVVTFSGAISNDGSAVASSYTGVRQEDFPDASNENHNSGTTAASVLVTTTVNNCWLAGIGFNQRTTFSAGSDTTIRNTQVGQNVSICSLDSDAPKTPTGEYSLLFTSGNSNFTGIMGVSMEPTPADNNSGFFNFF
jgi:hypothetical protein